MKHIFRNTTINFCRRFKIGNNESRIVQNEGHKKPIVNRFILEMFAENNLDVNILTR